MIAHVRYFQYLTVFIGVALTVFLYSYLNGFVSDMIKSSAHYNTGHVRIMTQAYSQESNQNPNDLALIGIDTLMQNIQKTYPDMIWTPRN